MIYEKDISVIIPCWRGAIKYLPKLLSSIPENDGIEVIIVDNSKDPVSRNDIDSQRDFTLLHSSPNLHAGGSRNIGMASAAGKWLLFADSDDYFAQGAFDVFYSKINSDADIIFSKPVGIFEDSGEYAERGGQYAKMVHDFCQNKGYEKPIRLLFDVPWCKLIRHSFVDKYNLQFDEIRAGNDVFFSVTAGFYANKIDAVDVVTYVVTVNRGSLTNLRNYEVSKARLVAKLRRNKFLKEKNLAGYQYSVMVHLKESFEFGISATCEFFGLVLKYRQNPFIGWQRWLSTFNRRRKKSKMTERYLVK